MAWPNQGLPNLHRSTAGRHFHETTCAERFPQPTESPAALSEGSHLSSIPFERGSVTIYVPYMFLASFKWNLSTQS
jgi:hypothetical protein